MQPTSPELWHGTTILTVRKGGSVVIGGDGQVTIGQTIVKPNAKKVRRLGKGDVIGGFAGATADAFTLFERLEGKLEQYPGQLTRAAVSVPANIAEGQGRLTRADFDRHLAIARDSLKEVESLLQVAERLKMLPPERITHALSLADEISRMLSTLITRLAKPRKR